MGHCKPGLLNVTLAAPAFADTTVISGRNLLRAQRITSVGKWL
jgi:hypothetical protein